MREICTSGSVGGEGGNILAYLALLATRYSVAACRISFCTRQLAVSAA